jgi:hypothetical protein
MHWSDEKLHDAEINGDLPGRSGEINPKGVMQ